MFQEFLKDMLERDVMGKVVAVVYSVEHQMKGPPHAHCLFTMDKSVPVTDPAWVDEYFNSRIPLMPDPEDHSEEANDTRAYIEFLADTHFHDCYGEF